MVKEAKNGVYVRNGKEYPFSFYTDLSVINKIKFVNSICDIVVDGNNFNFVILDLIFNFYIISTFTDIDVSDIDDSPMLIEAIEDFLTDNNAVDIVVANMKDGLIEELQNAVSLNIEYKTGIHKSATEELLVTILNRYNQMITDVNIEEVLNVAKMINENTEKFSPENIIQAFEDTHFGENKIQELRKTEVGGIDG